MCGLEIAYINGHLSAHLLRHHMKLNEYFEKYLAKKPNSRCRPEVTKYSNIPYDFSSYWCNLCDYSGVYLDLVNHIEQEHQLSPAAYKEAYGSPAFKEKVLHVCKICNQEVAYGMESLFAHLTQNHNRMTIEEYFESCLASHADDMPAKTCSTRYTDTPGDYSTFWCHICDFSGVYRALHRHIDTKHKLKTSQYKEIYGNYMVKENVRHICKHCRKEVTFVRDYLAAHLRQHNLSVEAYFDLLRRINRAESLPVREPDPEGIAITEEDVEAIIDDNEEKVYEGGGGGGGDMENSFLKQIL